MKTPKTSKAVPTRFKETETEFLHVLAEKTGFSVSELIRRSVRLMRDQMQRPGAEKVILSLVA